MLAVIGGCQQVQKRNATTSPSVNPSYESLPDFGSPIQPTPLQAPVLPAPDNDLEIPPVPGSAKRERLNDSKIGGFTLPALTDLEDEPRTLASDWFGETTDQVQTTAGEEELDLLIPDDLDLVAEEPVLLRDFLKSKPAPLVELDPDLFRLELEADALELPVPLPELAAPIISEAVAQPIVTQTFPQSAGGGAAPAWPAEGVASGIIITPGPSVQKWVDERRYPAVAIPPRRLADDNSDWAGRTIE